MDKEEIQETIKNYLKDNLSIELDISYKEVKKEVYKETTIKLYLDGEEISLDWMKEIVSVKH